ncbi:hypothetical protein F5Y15DRAFT_422608 [Xylariaceae sp. FL0016]|nr:hypothetical protein F5Y15DRAFT_422608 [Xylariaceae sp. FL0016]
MATTPAESPCHLTPIEEANHTSTSNDASIKSSGGTISYHADHDMGISVGGTIYAVIAATFAAASPVWRSLLYDRVAKIPENDIVIPLDGDAEAVGILCRIIHYKFSSVPDELSLDELYNLSCVTAQYKAVHLTHPWANKWLARFAAFSGDVQCHMQCHKLIWIAWEFGEVNLFREMTDALIISCKRDVNGRLTNTSNELLGQMILPHGLLERITDVRTNTITKLLGTIDSTVKNLTANGNGDTHYCKVKHDAKECEAMMFGSALPQLLRSDLYPVPDADKYDKSILDLKNLLDSIKTLAYEGRDWKPHKTHEGCSLRLREAAEKCLAEMPVVLDDCHLEYLSQQAEKSGVTVTEELKQHRRRVAEQESEESPDVEEESPVSNRSEGCNGADSAPIVDSVQDDLKEKGIVDAEPTVNSAQGQSDSVRKVTIKIEDDSGSEPAIKDEDTE